MGVRQLGHPVQGVRPAGRAARPVREDRRRRAGPPATPASRRRVALHIPWDKVDDYADLADHAARRWACALGTINSNVFQDDDYMLGSVCQPRRRGSAARPIDHLLECVDIMDATGSRDLKLWFADGTNYPGQDDIRGPPGPARRRAARGLRAARRRPADAARVQVLRAGLLHDGRARLGHRATSHCLALGTEGAGRASTPATTRPGTNIEFIVAHAAARRASSAAFDFNSRFYADDDLMVGAADPFQLFRIMHEVVAAAALGPDARRRLHARPVPQHRAQDPGQIRSVMNVQEATAKALLVDRDALAAAQAAGDVLGANAVLMDAYNTDVRPLLAELRDGAWASTRTRWPPTRASGYAERIAAERVGGQPGRAGAHEHRDVTRTTASRSSLDRSQPARRRPAQHQLRRRQHLGQGHGDRPGHRASRSSCCGSRAPAATSAR